MSDDRTREKIIDKALRMFSEKGFAGVSMRDIAREVGIQASSIYYYFDSKQAIFRALIRQADMLTNEYKAVFFKVLSQSESVEREAFVRAGILFVTGYLDNEKIRPLLHALESERFHDADADAAWKEMLFTAPLIHEAKAFAFLFERGIIKDKDAEKLAAEYHGITMLGYFSGDTERLASSLGDFYDRVFHKP